MAFKPKRTVTGPKGTWELYVSKYIGVVHDQLQRQAEHRRAEQRLHGAERIAARTGDSALLAEAERERMEHRPASPFSFILDVFRRRNSSAVKIEAIQWGPPDEKLIWTTTDQAVDRVLDEIVDGLREGNIVQPDGAVYSGAPNQIG